MAQGCFSRGFRAEDRFMEWVRDQAPDARIFRAALQDDMSQHWDVLVQPPSSASDDNTPHGIRIDVKALRRDRRGGALSSDHTWLELYTADRHRPGSVLGDADVLAFEVLPPLSSGSKDGGDDTGAHVVREEDEEEDVDWLIVPRARIVEWMRRVLHPTTAPVTKSREHAIEQCAAGTWTLYNRRGFEALLHVPLSLLATFAIGRDTPTSPTSWPAAAKMIKPCRKG